MSFAYWLDQVVRAFDGADNIVFAVGQGVLGDILGFAAHLHFWHDGHAIPVAIGLHVVPSFRVASQIGYGKLSALWRSLMVTE